MAPSNARLTGPSDAIPLLSGAAAHTFPYVCPPAMVARSAVLRAMLTISLLLADLSLTSILRGMSGNSAVPEGHEQWAPTEVWVRHATSVRQRNWFSVGIRPVPKATQ